jgi:hypothetical protein
VKPIWCENTVLLRGFVDHEPVLRAYLRYQEKVEDGTFRESAEIPLEEIM